MSRYAMAGAVGRVVLAAALGCAVALAVAMVYTAVNAVASLDSLGGQPEGGVIALVLVVAMLYGAATGAVVGLAGAALLPERAQLARWRRMAFVVLAYVIVAAATVGLRMLVEVPLALLVVPAVLSVPALALYLRRYAPR